MDGGRRAEWAGGDSGGKAAAWIWWKRPEEWAGVLAGWVSDIYPIPRGARGHSLIFLIGRGNGAEEYGFDAV